MLRRIEERERFRFHQLSSNEKKRLIESIEAFLGQRDEILVAILYGSFLKGASFRDIDIALYVRGGVSPIRYGAKVERELEELIGLPFDVRLMNFAPPWFIKRVIEEGFVLIDRYEIIEKLYLSALEELRRDWM